MNIATKNEKTKDAGEVTVIDYNDEDDEDEEIDDPVWEVEKCCCCAA